MIVREAIEFLKKLDQDIPLILYEDMPTYGAVPNEVELQLIKLDEEDAKTLDYSVGQQAVVLS